MNTTVKIAVGAVAAGAVLFAGVAPTIATSSSVVTSATVVAPGAQTSTNIGLELPLAPVGTSPTPVTIHNGQRYATTKTGAKEWFPEATR